MTPKSGLFLAISCIAAIAAVGCVFELSSGMPQWGQTPTTAILIGSIPITVIAFLAAVKDARANF
ncbi:MAG: hypothetical protein B0A82_12445 [Alkalinema sp. CACIAM 70d]|nr:MAG: hypothetical protein B0A82_12445 [Alkalinema sp. CACIAM 70d]